ncbi:MAG: DUF4397 domain-containing protein [Terriglobales bacterium]|jgi:hypothetical protein
MSRLLKALPLALSIAALIVFAAFAASCGSSSAQARFVNAISQAGSLDIDINGTKQFSSVGVNAASASTYIGVPSGSDTIEGFQAGGTTVAFASQTVSLNSGSSYTLVATGFLNGSIAPTVLNPVDNNTEPPNGSVSFRVIHASPDGQTPVDVYILPYPVTCDLGAGQCSAAVTSLAYQSVSTYATQNYNSGGGGFQMFVTVHGSTTPLFNFGPFSVGSSSVGSIRTIVLTDNSSGNGFSDSPIVLDDLN